MNGWEDLEAEARSHVGAYRPKCTVAAMLDIVQKEHGQAAHDSIIRTLANVRLTASSIHKALESRIEPDYLPSAFTLQRHRSGRCLCPKGEF